jgi:hypothetical protein
LIVTVWPSIVKVPLRAAPVFVDTLKVTVPLPLPLAPAVTETQLRVLVVVHAHPLAALTVTDVPVAPAAGTETDAGLIVTEQVAAVAAA